MSSSNYFKSDNIIDLDEDNEEMVPMDEDFTVVDNRNKSVQSKFEVGLEILRYRFTRERQIDIVGSIGVSFNQITFIPLTGEITRGNFVNNRLFDTIYYEEMEYTLVASFKTTSKLSLGEIKVALVWVKNPELTTVSNGSFKEFFALKQSNGAVQLSSVSSFLNPDYRKQVTVVRDTYLTTFVLPEPDPLDIPANTSLGERNSVFRKIRVKFNMEKKGAGKKMERNKESMCTQYDPSSGKIKFGQLGFILMGGNIDGLECGLDITGRLSFT